MPMCNYLLKNAPKDRSSVNEVENAQTHPLIQLRCLTCTSFSRFFHQVSLEVLGHISSNKEKDNFIAWQFGSDRAVETHCEDASCQYELQGLQFSWNNDARTGITPARTTL
jgi:hypothetical protein